MTSYNSRERKRKESFSETDGHESKRHFSFGDDPVVTLEVGPNRVRFSVHETLLCDASPFFKVAFTGGFKEQSGFMELVEDEPDVFERLIHWLYHREIHIKLPRMENTATDGYYQIFRLYILADKLAVVSLKDHIMDILIHEFSCPEATIPTQRIVAYVYENTTRGSEIRRYLATCYLLDDDLDGLLQKQNDWFYQVPDFAVDLAAAMAPWLKGRLKLDELLRVNDFQKSPGGPLK
ncbi:MAG: hypothetical protein Q9170_000510 [Blastenia crenularia]